MQNTWEVTVKVDNEKVITISDGHISGIDDVSDYEDEIRECAKHLLGFIGELGQFENRLTPVVADVMCGCGEKKKNKYVCSFCDG